MPGIFPTPGEVLQAQVVCSILGQTGQNILHWSVQTTTTGGASLQEIANKIDTNVAASYKAILSVAATYRGVGVSNTATPRSRQYFSVANAGLGSYGADLMPTQVRGLISWYADAGGRANRGRSYIPFPARSASDPTGLPTGAYLTALVNLRNAIFAPFTVTGSGGTTDLRMCLRHRPPVLIGPSIVVFAFARSKFATQRKSGAYGRSDSPPF